jgi:hypothetical protein
MTPEQEMQAGTQAKAIYESEPFQNSIESVRKGILDKWTKSPIADRDGQHELRLMYKLLDDVVLNIKSVIDSGKLAEHTILQDKKMEEAKRKWFNRALRS